MNCWDAMPAWTRPSPSVPGTWKPPSRSRPEQNPRPAPVSTTTRVDRSARRSSSDAVQVVHQLVVHGVEPVGPVQRDDRDARAWGAQLDGRHGRVSTREGARARGLLTGRPRGHTGARDRPAARPWTATTSWSSAGGTTPSSPPPTSAGPGCRCACSNGPGHVGGAAVSGRVFPGVDARLSRYSYLVSLLPDRIVADLGLDVTLASRPVASFTPVRRGGRRPRAAGRAGARARRRPSRSGTSPGPTTSTPPGAAFYDDAAHLAAAVAPTLLEPLPAAAEMRRTGSGAGAVGRGSSPARSARRSRRAFRDDTVRGVVLTDALIGTFAGGPRRRPAARTGASSTTWSATGRASGGCRWAAWAPSPPSWSGRPAAAGADLVTGAEVVAVAADGATAEVAYRRGGVERDGGRRATSSPGWRPRCSTGCAAGPPPGPRPRARR